ncbi:MAG: type I-U CRISPR-associated protein Csb2 [Gammaproteobacteria bacterium]|nr:type I-U CRISPR-associated protein Csb2 [Gammaproteobacteria bacterium]
MLEISVRFLGGEYVAQTPGARSEWPPHPARLLYALIAAWYENGCRQNERELLEWLESQEAPRIVAPPDAPDETYEAWLPMNSVPTWDKKGGKRPTLPRARKARSSRYVGDTPVRFVWDVDATAEHESALRDLCRRCTRLGSAESLVAMHAGRRADLHGPAWRPSALGTTTLRTPVPGIVDAIAASDALLPGRVLPCDWRAYRWISGRPPGRMLTVGLTRGNWPVEHAPALAAQLRQALVAVAEAEHLSVRPFLTGRDEDGSPLRGSHLHFCPLPHVGFRGAIGSVLGVSFIFPPETDESDRAYVERVIAAWFVRGGELETKALRLLSFGPADARRTLADERWCRGATVWQTVVPMELPRHVARRREWNRNDWNRIPAEIALACSQAGLPPPAEVVASNTAFAIGSPNSRTVRGPHRRPVVHARVLFPHAIDGPIVVGAGRHLGYGLMEPVEALS